VRVDVVDLFARCVEGPLDGDLAGADVAKDEVETFLRSCGACLRNSVGMGAQLCGVGDHGCVGERCSVGCSWRVAMVAHVEAHGC
jgi:hypothetical protein